MDAFHTDRVDLSYSERPPVIVAAASQSAAERARRTINSAGLRLADSVGIPDAQKRMERQISASAVWIELDEDCGGPMDDLLRQVSRDVADGRYAAVVAAPSNLLDSVISSVVEPSVELVVDGDDGERLAALAIASARAAMPLRVADVAGDKDAARLRQLSDEVSRIAAALTRLSASSGISSKPAPEEAPGDVPPLSAETVRSVIRARRLRSRYFPEDLFADPAWDMLLDLLQAEIAQLRVPVSSLCIAAAVPATTALRWLKTMVQQGLFVRRADPHDGRRVFVELAPDTSASLRRYFAEVGTIAVI